MALPTDPKESREQILARRRAAEEEALLREVDDAVRQDDLVSFGQNYGVKVAFVVGAGLLAFGGYLFWQSRVEAGREREAETLVTAMDQIQAGGDASNSGLASLQSEGGHGARAAARMLVAATAMTRNRPVDATRELDALAADANSPAALRDLARLRSVAARYDSMDKGQVIAQLGPLARPDSPWFGSAGELVAMAMLEQGKRAEAGRLFSDIARAPNVPDALRSRSRQMAGVLGVDAIPDADKFMQQQRARQQSAQQPAAPPAA